MTGDPEEAVRLMEAEQPHLAQTRQSTADAEALLVVIPASAP